MKRKKVTTGLVRTMLWMKILHILDNRNTAHVSYEVKSAYSHVTNVINEFINLGWVEKNNKGRAKILKLTESGKKVHKYNDMILTEMNRARLCSINNKK